MTARSPVITLVHLEPSSPVPLSVQMYERLRDLITDGTLATGTLLPSTRSLARELRVSRNTVMRAFDQLRDEGYIRSRVGAGSFVAPALPRTSSAPLLPVVPPSRSSTKRRVSTSGERLREAFIPWLSSKSTLQAFATGIPALDAFPYDIWARLSARRWRRGASRALLYGDASGLASLRNAVAEYLVTARAVRCTPEQILIVGGSQQALSLVARVLLDPGDVVWHEEPGYLGARMVFRAAGASVVPVAVDRHGLNPSAGIASQTTPRLIYVTPSHQYPLGVTMPIERRSELLKFAAATGAWLVEDDYDSEFRYSGRPLPALQGVDTNARVIYVGTFSKVLLPGMRLGYLVLPPDLLDAFIAARVVEGVHASQTDQAVVADFIAEGHFGRHLRRMRGIYAERQQVLVDALDRPGAAWQAQPSDAGMQLVLRLPSSLADIDASRAASSAGVAALPLSNFYMGPPSQNGLLLGFSGFRPPQIVRAARALTTALSR